MSSRPLRPCAERGCPTLVERGRCAAHAGQQRRQIDARRGSARERGYSHAWDVASKAHLRAHPLCYYCGILGRVVAAQCVDHATPHKGDETLFWDEANWRSACLSCNNSKGDDDEAAFRHRIGA